MQILIQPYYVLLLVLGDRDTVENKVGQTPVLLTVFILMGAFQSSFRNNVIENVSFLRGVILSISFGLYEVYLLLAKGNGTPAGELIPLCDLCEESGYMRLVSPISALSPTGDVALGK